MQEQTATSLTVTYTPSLEDHYAHYKYHRGRRNFWQQYEFSIILGIILLFTYISYRPNTNRENVKFFVFIGTAIFLGSLLYGFMMYINRDVIKRNFKKMQKQIKERQSSGMISITIAPEAFFIHTDISDERHLWKLIQDVGEYNDYGYLSLNEHTAFIIPERAFKDKAQFEEFMHTALEYFEASR